MQDNQQQNREAFSDDVKGLLHALRVASGDIVYLADQQKQLPRFQETLELIADACEPYNFVDGKEPVVRSLPTPSASLDGEVVENIAECFRQIRNDYWDKSNPDSIEKLITHGLSLLTAAMPAPNGVDGETERAIEQLIDERDAAEDALSQAYYLVTGRSPKYYRSRP